MKTRVLTGITTTGTPHLGNYVGAIRPAVAASKRDDVDAFYFMADYHALIKSDDADRVEASRLMITASWLALGLDPAKATFYRQSDVPEVTELAWVLATVTGMGLLERAHSYKDKVARGISPNFGLFAYPVLMAADILLYESDVVPVGKDQVQHIEFARDWATKFNIAYVPGYDAADPLGQKTGAPGILKLPEAKLAADAAVVPGIDGQKMSKSYGNAIEIFGDVKATEKRIMSIKTDSTDVESPKPTEDSALYQLLKVMAPPGEFAAIDASWRAGGKGYGHYKKQLVELYHATFDGPREKREQLLADPGEVERILKDGAERARAIAVPLLDRVRRAVGLR